MQKINSIGWGKVMFITVLVLASSIAFAQVTVNSLIELLPYLDDDHADVVLSPGTYTITAEDITSGVFSDYTTIAGKKRYVLFLFEGNNSTYDFTGVTINVETAVFNAIPSDAGDLFQIQIIGNNNVLKNLKLEDVGSVYDFPKYGCVNIVMDGHDNRIEGFHMTVRGSYPYGYGDCFGKGGTYTIKHYKHSAFLVRGTRNHALNDTIFHYSYGHAIFMQAASYPTIEGCYVEGEVRSTDDMLAEEGTGSAADKIDFFTVWGYRLPPGFMKSTGEAGIRAYNAGNTIIDGVESERGTDNPTILNCYIKNLRVGVTITHATGKKYVEGVTAIGTERGFATGSGDIVDCYADAQYGAVFGVDYETDKNINAEITVLPYEGETYNGSKHLVYILGSGHNITLRSTVPNPDQDLKIDFCGDKRIISSTYDTENFISKNITINNYTNYPIVLDDNSSYVTGVSGGMVTDFGTNNSINHTAVSAGKYEAENFIDTSGVFIESCADEGGGQNLSSIEVNDWMEYEIDVPFAGTYTIDYRVASESSGGDFTVNVDGATKENVTFSATGGAQTWTTITSSTPFFLNKGIQKLKLTANSANWKINWIDLSLECALSEIEPYVEVLNTVGVSLGLEESADLTVFPGNTVVLKPEPSVGGSWDWLGPNGFWSDSGIVEIKDIQESNAGDYLLSYRNDCGQEDVKTINIKVEDSFLVEAESYSEGSEVTKETCTDEGGGENLTSIEQDDWVEYKIEVPFSATYFIDYRVASETSNGDFIVRLDSVEVDKINFSAAGGGQSWTTVSSDSLIYLSEGEHTLRLISNSEDWKLNWIKLRGKDFVSPCKLPFEHDGFVVQNQAVSWTTGVMDITCVSNINVYVELSETGTLTASDSLNIYYKLDGGTLTEISKNTGSLSEMVGIEKALSGTTLEIIIKGASASTDDYYTVTKISVVETTDQFARIEAEDFDDMVGVNASATRLGSIQPGEWSMYAGLDLTGMQSIDASVGTVYDDAYIEVRLDSVNGPVVGTIYVPNTGDYNSYHTASANISVITGIFDVYLVYQTESSPNVCNIDWFQFSDEIIDDTRNTFDRIEAEDYDTMSDIQLESTGDEGGGLNVGWINNGDWLMFANIDLTGVKSIDSRVASNVTTSKIEIRLDSSAGTLLGTVSIPNTGGFQTWKTANTTLSAVEGKHDVYLVFTGGDGYLANINWIQFIGTPTAIKPEFSESEILIYPNPVTDRITIKNALKSEIRIYDNVGRLVSLSLIENNVQTINMKNQNPGLYFLRIITPKGAVKNFKVMKQ